MDILPVYDGNVLWVNPPPAMGWQLANFSNIHQRQQPVTLATFDEEIHKLADWNISCLARTRILTSERNIGKRETSQGLMALEGFAWNHLVATAN